MSWNFTFKAKDRESVARELDAQRVSQGGHCPDKFIDAVGYVAECAITALATSDLAVQGAVQVSSHGHFDERSTSGNGTFQVTLVAV